nr:replication protein antisense ORF [Acetobacter sp.]
RKGGPLSKRCHQPDRDTVDADGGPGDTERYGCGATRARRIRDYRVSRYKSADADIKTGDISVVGLRLLGTERALLLVQAFAAEIATRNTRRFTAITDHDPHLNAAVFRVGIDRYTAREIRRSSFLGNAYSFILLALMLRPHYQAKGGTRVPVCFASMPVREVAAVIFHAMDDAPLWSKLDPPLLYPQSRDFPIFSSM